MSNGWKSETNFEMHLWFAPEKKLITIPIFVAINTEHVTYCHSDNLQKKHTTNRNEQDGVLVNEFHHVLTQKIPFNL